MSLIISQLLVVLGLVTIRLITWTKYTKILITLPCAEHIETQILELEQRLPSLRVELAYPSSRDMVKCGTKLKMDPLIDID